MNQVVPILLFALLFIESLTHSAGHGGGLSQRCLCRGKLRKTVNPKQIHNFELFQPSPSCSNREIVLTLNEGRGKGKGKGKGKWLKVCLDPNEKQGKRFLKARGRQNPKNKGKKMKKKFDNRDNK